jgi:hypothetical protein
MHIWLDDVRPMPEGYDVHCKTAEEAINLIKSGKVTFVSLDHDLGEPEAGTGYQVACAIETLAWSNAIPKLGWAIHSANPVGRNNMQSALRKAIHFWSNHEQAGEV